MPKTRKCRARGCANKNNDVRFYSFPKEPAAHQIWKENLKIPPEQKLPTHSAFVCIKHFEESAIGGKLLKNGAIPTLNLGSNRNPKVVGNLEYKEWDLLPTFAAYVCILHFEDSTVGAKCLKKGAIPALNLGYDHAPPHSNRIFKRKWARVCSIENCIGDEKRRVYKFPANTDSWFKVCNIDRSKCHIPYICELHFDKKFVSKFKLLFGAFPSLNLPPQITSNNSNITSENARNETLKCNENKGNKRACCIKSCGGDDNGALFSFPNVEEASIRWMKACRINPVECGELYICARHFHSSFLANENKVLKDGAFPSLNLCPQPADGVSGHALLPTLQKPAVPPTTIKFPLDFEQHYFVESKRKRLYSQDTDENSKCISFVSENEELISNVPMAVKCSDATTLECDNETITDDINEDAGLDQASSTNKGNDLDRSNVKTSNEKLYKCDKGHLEKRLAKLETLIEFQPEESKNYHDHFEKRFSELEARIDLQSKPTHICNCAHFEKKLIELESQMESEWQNMRTCYREHFEKRIAKLEAEVEFLKTKHRILADRAIMPFNNASKESITFARMIVDCPKRMYSEKEKSMAQNLNYLSPKAYDFMREELKLILPHKSVLRRWRPTTGCTISGIDDNASKSLKNIVSQMSESERICQIMFDDETDIQKDEASSSTLTYAAKARATSYKCCLFMVKGIFSDWKYILSYYIENTGFNAYNLLRYLNQNLVFAESVGLKVKAIVCDQTLCNAHIYKMLYVTEKKPYILHEKEKIHCFFDYFYLTKAIRNSFLAHDIKTIDGVVRCKVVRKLYTIDKAYVKSGFFPKLTPTHLYPNNVEKKNVYLAAQLLSHSVSVGIQRAINENIFGTDPNLLKCAKATQTFIQRMNDLFDEFDHRDQHDVLKDNKTSRSYTEKINILYDHLKFLHSLEEHNTINMRFLPALILTTKSMINFYEDVFTYHDNFNINELGKLNQEALNIFFHELRRSKDVNTCFTENEICTFITNSRREFEQKYKNPNDKPSDNLIDVIVATDQSCDNTELSEEQFEKYIEVVEDCLS